MANLEKAIIRTLVFFDIFNYPLTLTEIWKWLYKPDKKYSLAEIRSALEHSEILKEKLSSQEGFYSLKGREEIYLVRKRNNNLVERKFSKALRITKFFRLMPFIKMVAICNSLAYGNAKNNSDIDFFIITQKNKIWLARFFTILVTKFLGKRPRPGDNKDAFCLSFFITEEHLSIKRIMLNDKDIYSYYWLSQIMPLYDPANFYEKFLQANPWLLNNLPQAYANEFVKEIKQTAGCRLVGKIFQWFVAPPLLANRLAGFYRQFQLSIIDRNLKSLVNVDTRVMIDEQMLKFHANDRRELFYHQWLAKLAELNI
jgi:predicted nucleotidyltransferase